MTKSQIQKLMKKIVLHQNAIARERDNLDDTIDSMKSLSDDCTEAFDALELARDALSKLV